MAGQDSIIELRGVDKSFEDTRALEDINLRISNGEFLTLLGPSGCGKTTILRILSGFESPDSGEVLIGGGRMNDIPPERRQVNTVFQNYAPFPAHERARQRSLWAADAGLSQRGDRGPGHGGPAHGAS